MIGMPGRREGRLVNARGALSLRSCGFLWLRSGPIKDIHRAAPQCKFKLVICIRYKFDISVRRFPITWAERSIRLFSVLS